MTNSAQTDQIFLSYRRTDKDAAEILRSRLIGAGFNVFRDEESIRIGDNWLQTHAASGAGKLSLVRAGVLPKIEQGLLWRRTGYADWKILEPMVPGEKPVEMLAKQTEPLFGGVGGGSTLPPSDGAMLCLRLNRGTIHAYGTHHITGFDRRVIAQCS